jgi:hypothetical protein
MDYKRTTVTVRHPPYLTRSNNANANTTPLLLAIFLLWRSSKVRSKNMAYTLQSISATRMYCKVQDDERDRRIHR